MMFCMEAEIKKIDLMLKSDLSIKMRKDLERKKSILLNDKIIEK